MKAMTAYIMTPSNADALETLMAAEIVGNKANLPQYSDWAENDKGIICSILDEEYQVLCSLQNPSCAIDSVKGEEAMKVVYRSNVQGKATDAITRLANGVLVLTEAKYLMRFGGKGPFRGRDSFRQRVSGKFNEMAKKMQLDGENVSPLRVIVTTGRQFPISVNHIQAMVAQDDPVGSYSDDGRAYEYVLCSSESLRQIVNNPMIARAPIGDCFFFTL